MKDTLGVRRAYLAYRERQYNPPQQDGKRACSTLPKSSRNFEKPVSTSSKKDTVRSQL